MTRRMIAPLLFGIVGVAVLRLARGLAGAAAGLEDRDPRRDRRAAGGGAGGGAGRPRPGARPSTCGSRRAGAIEPGELARLHLGAGARRRLPGDRAAAARRRPARSCSTAASCRSARRTRRGGSGRSPSRASLHWPQETDRFTSRAGPREEHLVRPRRAADGRGARDRAGDAGDRRRATIRARRCRCR